MDRVDVAKLFARAKGLTWDNLDGAARTKLLNFVDARGLVAVYQLSTRQPFPSASSSPA